MGGFDQTTDEKLNHELDLDDYSRQDVRFYLNFVIIFQAAA